jgi:hypothetical protein
VAVGGNDGEERCRAAEAVVLLEELLYANREFRYYKSAENDKGESLASWLLRAHVRARRCTSRQNRVPVHIGDAGEEYHVGDIVEFVEGVQDWWNRGDMARVIGLGRSTSPIAIRMQEDLRHIDGEAHIPHASLRTRGSCTSISAL